MKEIERKFLVECLPEDLEKYPRVRIEQGYLCTDPVVRVRRRGEEFWLTCKGPGLLTREEFELPLSEEAFVSLMGKTEGTVIRKDRYLIPWGEYTVELDVFDETLAPLVVAEVEFLSEEEAAAFAPPHWFGRDVTEEPAYTNAALSRGK